jgi:hypothetical protein
LVGKTFGRLTVVEKAPSRGGKTYWLCECSCELRTRKEVQGVHLTQGAIQSCGCLRDEATRERSITHGQTGTRLYNSWRWMKWRCSPDAKDHRPHYADWGIRVCDVWVNSFEQFASDMGPHPEQGLTLDRRDNDRGYEPGNCRWATRSQQNANQGHQISLPVSAVPHPLQGN